MKRLVQISPLVFSLTCLAQHQNEKATKIDFGFSSATFFGVSAVSPLINKAADTYDGNRTHTVIRPTIPLTNFGWKQGLFFWINLNSFLSYKPQLDFVYSVNSYGLNANGTPRFSTSLGYELKPQLIIKPCQPDRQPIIKMARCMSYYLSGKQPYIIAGPKFGYYKSDRRFEKENNSQYYTIGCIMGAGLDNMFHNMDFAPEMTVSVDYRTGNHHINPKAINRYFVTASLAINFF